MKKVVYGVLFLAVVGTTIIGCQKESINPTSNVTANDNSKYNSQKFFYENIAFHDARIRSLNKNQYVQEVYLKNFSDENWVEESIGLQGKIYEDNGLNNDLIANDGIFTSIQQFDYNDKVSYDKKNIIKSVMNVSVISPEFKHQSKFESFSKKYQYRSGGEKGIDGSITCKVKVVSTGCIADWIWDGFGCLEFSDCSVTIGFSS